MLIIVGCTALAHWPGLQGTFLWDDDVYVTNNPALLSLDGLRRIWFDPGGLRTQYYPLTLTTLWIEHQFFGNHPLGYHVTNVALHAVSAALFYILLARMRLPGALLGALIFALHPMQVESVAWVTQRKNLLCGVWVMLTLLCWVRYLGTRSARAYAAALISFLFALLSKSAAVPLPAVLALVAWGWDRPTLRRDLLATVPFAVLAVTLALVTVFVERSHGFAGGFGRDINWAESTIIAGRALWFYVWKFLLPIHLTSIYPKWTVNPARAEQYAFTLAAVAVIVGLWLARRRLGRWPLVAVLTYVCLIAPVLSFVDFGFLGHSYVADHFFYLPMVGLAALIAGAAAALFQRLGARGTMMAWAGGATVAATLGALSWRQGRLYRDAETFWAHNVSVNPTHSGYHNLGEACWARGEAARTIELNLASVAVQDNTRARYRLGTVYDRLGRYDEALEQFERALRLNRAADRNREIERNTLFNIGSLYWLRKEREKAAEYWEAALSIDPEFKEAREWLAKVKPAPVG